MDSWRRRVNEALDALLAARIAKSCVRKQLDTQQGQGTPEDTKKLQLLWCETCEAASAAMLRVEAVLWE